MNCIYACAMNDPGRDAACRLYIIVFILLIAAAASRFAGDSYFITSVCTWAAMVMFAIPFRGGKFETSPGLPHPKSSVALWIIPAACALFAIIPTFGLPYFADDYCLVGGRGQIRNFFDVFIPDPDRMFFRPVGWITWWLIGQFSPDSAVAPRILASLLFVITVALIPIAARRAGFPRGIAFWTAILFAVHPFSLETVAWLSNYYSYYSLLFCIAALLCISPRQTAGKCNYFSPPRDPQMAGSRPRRGHMLPTVGIVIFSSLAFLSKEESLAWLPPVAFWIASRYRIRNWKSALQKTWPLFAAAFVIFMIRYNILDGLGGYRNPATQKPLEAWLYRHGLESALATELPIGYVLPVRISWHGGWMAWAAGAASFILLILLALAKRTRGLARSLQLLFIVSPLILIPIAPLIPSGPELAGARLFYTYSLFIILVIVSAIAAIRAGRIVIIASLVIFGIASIAAGRHNVKAWADAGEYIQNGVQIAASELREMVTTRRERYLILGLPDNVHGAICARNGGPFAIGRLVQNPGLILAAPPDDEGNFNGIFRIDYATKKLVSVLGGEARVKLQIGESHTWNFKAGSGDRDRVRLFIITPSDAKDGSWVLRSQYGGSGVVFEVIDVAPNSQLRVRLDGEVLTEGAGVEFAAIRRKGLLIERVFVGKEDLIDVGAEDGGRVAIEMRVPKGGVVKVKSVSVEVVKR